MRNALKSLKRMKLMAFLIVLQLSISLMLINSASTIIEGTRKKADGFERLMNFNETYLLRIINPEGEQITMEQVKADPDYVSKIIAKKVLSAGDFNSGLEKIRQKGILKNVYYDFPLPGLFSQYLSDEIKSKYTAVDSDLSSILVNYDFINDYKLPIYEGRSFVKEDFDVDYRKEPIPIILGKNYMENIKIGDILKFPEISIESTIMNKTFDINKEYDSKVIPVNMTAKVIGFYDTEAIPIMFTKDSFIENVNFSDSLSIIPCVKNMYSLNELIVTSDYGVFVEANSPSDIDIVKKELEPKLKEQGLEIGVTDLTNEASKIKEVMLREVSNSAILGGVLMLLSIIGITCVLLGELNERKKEFGVRISCGAEIKTLCKEMICEIGLMVTLASIISIVLMLIKQHMPNSSITLSLNIVIVNVIIIAILTIIVSLMPIMRLRKMNPVDLVRGE